jgi:hypothetical protein
MLALLLGRARVRRKLGTGNRTHIGGFIRTLSPWMPHCPMGNTANGIAFPGYILHIKASTGIKG